MKTMYDNLTRATCVVNYGDPAHGSDRRHLVQIWLEEVVLMGNCDISEPRGRRSFGGLVRPGTKKE